MSEWVVFDNAGEADVFALTTFGVTAKAGSSPIGFFGTGFKYAMAVLTRNGARIVLQVGERGHTISCKTRQSRGEEFQVVCMGARELGFTTLLGRGWDTWAAYRELWCNTADEQEGSVYVSSVLPRAEAGRTRICVRLPELTQWHERRGEIILQSKPISVGTMAQVHPGGQSPVIFYRGMRAMDLPKHSRLVWNITQSMTLTEDRTVKYQHEVLSRVVSTVLTSEDADLIHDVVTAEDGWWEHDLDFTSVSVDPSATFLDTVMSLRGDGKSRVNMSAYHVVAKRRKEAREEIRGEDLSEQDEQDLAWSIRQLGRAGWAVDRGEIRVVNSLGEGVMGMAEKGVRAGQADVIWLSREAFVQGRRRLMGTIYEEWVHLKLGYVDTSRGMQNHLIDTLMSLVERVIDED